MEMKGVKIIEGAPSEIPIYSTEFAISHGYLKECEDRITITTARFGATDNGGVLVGIRSVFYVDMKNQRATLHNLLTWTPGITWNSLAKGKAPARHRDLLAKYLMKQWDMGKLRGRVNYTL